MKRLLFVGLLLASVVGGFLYTAQPTSAERILTEAQIEQIRSKCTETRAELDRLHAADALLRVNLGQQYENISTRILASFNSRMALNKLYDTGLTETTSEYDKVLAEYRAAYGTYEPALARAIQINCSSKPIEFYEQVQIAREKRRELYSKTQRLNELLAEYQSKFTKFRSGWQKGSA